MIERRGNTIKLRGDLLFQTVVLQQKNINKYLKTIIQPHILLDFSAVKKCDSAGLALVIEVIRKVKKTNKTVSFASIPPQMRALAKFCEVDELITSIDANNDG